MESAQNYGADVEKRALKDAEGREAWERDAYEQDTHSGAPPPRRRGFSWVAATVVFFLTTVTVFQAEHVYKSARYVMDRVTGKDTLGARQASSSNSSLTYGTLTPFQVAPLPLGSIKPLGWLQTEMEHLADGLAGHEMDFYPVVSDSKWLGGSTDYSVLNEGLPYWLNGVTSLAYGLGDQTLIDQVRKAASYVIKQQTSNGFVGPVYYNDSRDLWSRYPLMLGLHQIADADPSMTNTIVNAIHKFVPHANDLLTDGALAANNEDWARSRYPDMILTLQWLFEKHPMYNGTDQRGVIWQMMNRLMNTGIDWAGYYTQQSYFFNDIDTIPVNTADGGFYFPFLHGVNVGQGLKAMAVNYRFTHNQSLIPVQKDAVQWTMDYHGAASGTILGDEREVGLAPNRGSELCTTVETVFSMHTIYSILGDNYYADRAELAAFNALPAMLTGDHWAHQYIALPNQPWSAPVAGSEIFWNVGDYGITFGTSPNYPCCTVNHPQGYPKFLASTFMTSGTDGLAHVLLAPANVTTKLGNGANVNIAALTNYPFSDILHYQITSSAPFTFYVRVPGWATAPGLTVNGQQVAVAANSGSGLAPINIPAGSSTVQFVLNSQMHTIERANDTVAIFRGALMYALDVGQVNTSTPGSADITRNQPPSNDPSVQQALQYNTSFNVPASDIPADARDYNISNTLPWNYAIDESTLKFYAYNGSKAQGVNQTGVVTLSGENGTSSSAMSQGIHLMPEAWEYQSPTQYITGQACLIDWPMLGGSPFRPPLKGDRKCQSSPVTVVFRPYGSLKLRMGELPLVTFKNSTHS